MRPYVTYDPMGAVQDGTYASDYLNETMAAGSWFRLPAGVWALQVSAIFDPTVTGEQIAEPFHCDSRMTVAGINPVFGSPDDWQMLSGPVYQRADTLPANRLMGTLGFFIITPEMIAAAAQDSPAGSGWATTMQFYQTSGEQRTLQTWSLIAARIA